MGSEMCIRDRRSGARVAEAEHLLRAAIAHEQVQACGAPPMEHAFRYNLGNLLVRAARHAEAAREYDAALLLSPNNEDYREAARAIPELPPDAAPSTAALPAPPPAAPAPSPPPPTSKKSKRAQQAAAKVAAKAAAKAAQPPQDSPAPIDICLLYTSPSPRDGLLSRMPSSA